MSLTISVAEIVAESSDPLLGTHVTWARVPLSQIASILNGYAFESRHFSSNGGLPLLRIRDVGNALTECTYDGPFDPRYVTDAGDLVIGMDGDFKCGRWRGPPALLNQRVCKVTVITDCYEPRLLDIVLPGYLRAVNARTSSQTVRHLSSKSLADVPLPLPPLAEQYRIVAKVEELLGLVNAAHDRLKRVPVTLKRLRQSVLAAACSGRLTADWREAHPDVEPAAVMLEQLMARRGAQLGLWLHHSDETVPIELPESWAWSTLGTFLNRIEAGKSFLCFERPPFPDEVGVVKVSSVSWGQFRETESKTCTHPGKIDERLFVRPGDFLFSRANTIELVGACVVAERVERSVMLSDKILRLHFDDIDPLWVLHLLRSRYGRSEIERLATGNQQAMRNIAQGSIRQIRVPVPPLAEQNEVVRRVEALFSLADAIERRAAAATSRVERLTQAILAKAFRGELVPTEAELARNEGRDYETAEALLDRIATRTRTRGVEGGVDPR